MTAYKAMSTPVDPVAHAAGPGDRPGGASQVADEPDGAGSDAGAAAFVVAALLPPVTFSLDEDAFDRWFTESGGDGVSDSGSAADEVPDWVEYGAGTMLARLFADACRSGVIRGDSGIELNVYGDDDGETSGFYVVLNNRVGAQTALGLTSGWQELLHLDDQPPQSRARAYLDEICAIANFTLEQLQVLSRASADNRRRRPAQVVCGRFGLE